MYYKGWTPEGFTFFTQTKVGYFDITIDIKQQVVQLEISEKQKKQQRRKQTSSYQATARFAVFLKERDSPINNLLVVKKLQTQDNAGRVEPVGQGGQIAPISTNVTFFLLQQRVKSQLSCLIFLYCCCCCSNLWYCSRSLSSFCPVSSHILFHLTIFPKTHKTKRADHTTLRHSKRLTKQPNRKAFKKKKKRGIVWMAICWLVVEGRMRQTTIFSLNQ